MPISSRARTAAPSSCGPLAQHARVDDRALGAGQHVAHVHDPGRIGQAQRHHARAARLQRTSRRLHRGLHLGRHAVEVVVLRQGQAQPAQWPVEPRQDGGHRTAAAGPVARIVARDELEHQRAVPDGARHRAQVIERPGQRHRAGPAHPPVRRLQSDDAAAGRRQADRAARVGAQRAEGQLRRHRGRPSRSRSRRRHGRPSTGCRRCRGAGCPRTGRGPARSC